MPAATKRPGWRYFIQALWRLRLSAQCPALQLRITLSCFRSHWLGLIPVTGTTCKVKQQRLLLELPWGSLPRRGNGRPGFCPTLGSSAPLGCPQQTEPGLQLPRLGVRGRVSTSLSPALTPVSGNSPQEGRKEKRLSRGLRAKTWTATWENASQWKKATGKRILGAGPPTLESTAVLLADGAEVFHGNSLIPRGCQHRDLGRESTEGRVRCPTVKLL